MTVSPALDSWEIVRQLIGDRVTQHELTVGPFLADLLLHAPRHVLFILSRHINLYTAERLVATVGLHFQNTFVFGMNDEVVHTGFYPMCHYLFVLGTGTRR